MYNWIIDWWSWALLPMSTKEVVKGNFGVLVPILLVMMCLSVALIGDHYRGQSPTLKTPRSLLKHLLLELAAAVSIAWCLGHLRLTWLFIVVLGSTAGVSALVYAVYALFSSWISSALLSLWSDQFVRATPRELIHTVRRDVGQKYAAWQQARRERQQPRPTIATDASIDLAPGTDPNLATVRSLSLADRLADDNAATGIDNSSPHLASA